MPKWLIDGLIGWGAVAALTVIVSFGTDAPYAFLSIVLYGLFFGTNNMRARGSTRRSQA